MIRSFSRKTPAIPTVPGARRIPWVLETLRANVIFTSNPTLSMAAPIKVRLRRLKPMRVTHNTLTYSSFNTHGYATSSQGVRHFEVYNNRFIHDGGTAQIANQNWAIWIRGGTGVIFNNQIDNIAGSYWGDKAELKLTIRGAEDVRPQGSCANVSYPVPRQLGQNHNGSGYFTDPIYVWGNKGSLAISDGWNWGNPCGFSWGTFFQWGRDAINNQSSGTGKPGYSPYTYPHPLLSGSGQVKPNPPTDVLIAS